MDGIDGIAVLRLAVALGGITACLASCKRHEEEEDYVAVKAVAPIAPSASVRAPAPECDADKDCLPDNCCFAHTATSCIPAPRAHCSSSAIVCEPSNEPRFKCACTAGKCTGTADSSYAFAPPVDAGPPAWATGALSQSDVLDVIIRRGDDVRTCHALAKKASGVAVVKWTVLGSGNVDQAAMSASTVAVALSKCLVKKISGWRFPKSKGTTQVAYEFRFGT